jgi:hypothetical protein
MQEISVSTKKIKNYPNAIRQEKHRNMLDFYKILEFSNIYKIHFSNPLLNIAQISSINWTCLYNLSKIYIPDPKIKRATFGQPVPGHSQKGCPYNFPKTKDLPDY